MIMITGVLDGFDAGDHPFFSFCIHDQKFGVCVWRGKQKQIRFNNVFRTQNVRLQQRLSSALPWQKELPSQLLAPTP